MDAPSRIKARVAALAARGARPRALLLDAHEYRLMQREFARRGHDCGRTLYFCGARLICREEREFTADFKSATWRRGRATELMRFEVKRITDGLRVSIE